MLTPNQSFVMLPHFVNITSCEYCFFDLCLSLTFRKEIKTYFTNHASGIEIWSFFFLSNTSFHPLLKIKREMYS